MKKHISIIVFYGALWGLVEATLGHVLHVLPMKIGWMFWFPIAFFFMKTIYLKTGEKSSVIYLAIIAALIKLIDFFNPVRIDYVINPAISIILEGLVMFAGLKIIEKYKVTINYFSLISISTGWRILYILYVLCLPYSWIKISPIGDWNHFSQYFIIENIINSLIIYACYKLANKLNRKNGIGVYNYSVSPYFSLMILVLTVYIQWAL